MSYNSQQELEEFAKKRSVEYLLLSDPGSETIKAYGIFNKEMKPETRYYGIPYPGTFLIDGEGVVRAKFFLEGYKLRVDPAELIGAAEGMQARGS